MNLFPDQLEQLRCEGIDAYIAGKKREDNPYSYEASQAWDSGWCQAEQRTLEIFDEASDLTEGTLAFIVAWYDRKQGKT